jgi:hypothetical protein
MKPKVGIGITTYEDIRSRDFGLAVYEALYATSAKLAPYRIEVIGDKHEVAGAQDFASHWCTELRLVLRPKHGVAPSYTPPSDFGADWRTKGVLSGDGNVFFGGRDPNAPSTLIIQHNFATNLAWEGLFLRLVKLLKPAHANLHVFTKRELELAREGAFAFRNPIAGEGNFTSWVSPLGTMRGPDPWEVDERRRYRFLPDLAWGNFLGPEFSGRFDQETLLGRPDLAEELGGGILLHVTENLSDVVKRPAFFESERSKLRLAFADDFFRSD